MRFTLSLMLVAVALPTMAEARTAKAPRAARPVKHDSRLAAAMLPTLALPATGGLAAFAMASWAGGRAPAIAPTVSPQ